jgi:hypothetical protein
MIGSVPRGLLGICSYTERRIIVRAGLTPLETVGVLVHESLHAAYPDLSEEAIERGEYAIMQALRVGGFLPTDGDD